MMTTSPKIFISHSWDDKELVIRLEGELRAAGFDVWVDHHEVRGGERISKEVSDALEWCDTFLLIWSAPASSSKWVELEWSAAVNAHKTIIPCLLDETQLPAIIAAMAGVSFTNYDEGLAQLKQSLNSIQQPIARAVSEASSTKHKKDREFIKGAWKGRQILPYACAAIVVILAALSLVVGKKVYNYFVGHDKTIVLVAEFDGPDPHHYRVTSALLAKLRHLSEKYSDIEIKPLDQVIKESGGTAVARAEAVKRKASIVIWGWYGITSEAVLLSANFEVLRKPEYMPKLKPTDMRNPPPKAEIESYRLQTRLSAEMAYLTLFTSGMARYAVDDWDAAIERFSEALTESAEPVSALNQSAIYYKRGVSYSAKGDHTKAIVDFDDAIRLKPDYADAYVSRGSVYLRQHDYDRAIADYERAIKLDPQESLAYYDRGLAHYLKNDYGRAITDYNEAIKLKREDALVYLQRGRAYHAQENYDRAIDDYNRALSLKPDKRTYYHGGFDPAWVYADRGRAYFSKSDYDRAIADFNQAIQAKADVATYNERGRAFYAKGQLGRAIADYNEGVKLNNRDPQLYYNRGIAYFAKGDIERAIADYDQAINLSPKHAAAHNNRGNAHKHKGDLNRAIADYDRAIELEPRNALAYHNRGLAYFAKGDLDRAIADYNKSIALTPRDALPYNDRGLAYFRKGDYLRAIADYDRAIRLNPDYTLAHDNRRNAYKAQAAKASP